MAKQNRNPIDFDTKAPPKAVTDPEAQARIEEGKPGHDPNYPCHLVKPDLEGAGGHHNREVVVAGTAAEEKRYRAQGYMSHHDADLAERKAQGKTAPATRAKPRAARKPANRQPKPVADPAVE